MKKAVSILLLSIFLLSQIGHQLVFTLAKWDAKNLIRQQLQSSHFDGIVETIQENKYMHWEEKDTEFELFGQMFDVIKKEMKGDSTVYFCINDSKEQELLTMYHQWMQHHDSDNDKKNNAKVALKYISIECEIPMEKEKQKKINPSVGYNPYISIQPNWVYLKVDGIPPQYTV